jgi:hypothetical protein
LRLVQVGHGARVQRLGYGEKRVDSRLAPREVVRLAGARHRLEQHLERVGLDQLLASARVLAQFGEQLVKAFLSKAKQASKQQTTRNVSSQSSTRIEKILGMDRTLEVYL